MQLPARSLTATSVRSLRKRSTRLGTNFAGTPDPFDRLGSRCIHRATRLVLRTSLEGRSTLVWLREVLQWLGENRP